MKFSSMLAVEKTNNSNRSCEEIHEQHTVVDIRKSMKDIFSSFYKEVSSRKSSMSVAGRTNNSNSH